MIVMTFTASNTVEQMMLDAAAKLGGKQAPCSAFVQAEVFC
jgi:hypothetical protein